MTEHDLWPDGGKSPLMRDGACLTCGDLGLEGGCPDCGRGKAEPNAE